MTFGELNSKLFLVFLWLMLTLNFRKDHEKAEFEVHEVYAVDVLISTGEGKVSVLSRPLFIPIAAKSVYNKQTNYCFFTLFIYN